MVKHNRKTYVILICVFLGSLVFYLVAKEVIASSIASISMGGSLFVVLYQILRDQSNYEKQLDLAERRERHELSTIAIEKRLDVHQKAFSLWWEMKMAPSGEPLDIYTRCRLFLKDYSVYLTDEAREAFEEACELLSQFGSIGKDISPEGLSKLFNELGTKGEKIRDAMNLPDIKNSMKINNKR